LTKKAPYKGPGADSEEKREPVSDINTAVVDSLKVLDPKRPIREADMSPEERNRASSALGKSFSLALEKSGSIGIANTVFCKTLPVKSIA
jgi:hypothetical protein